MFSTLAILNLVPLVLTTDPITYCSPLDLSGLFGQRSRSAKMYEAIDFSPTSVKSNYLRSSSCMSKLLPVVLVTTTLFMGVTERYPIATAGTCVAASSCGQQPIKFIPGQRITVEVVNLTRHVIQLQKITGTTPVGLSPGQMMSFARGGKTEPNFSVVLWDVTGRPMKVNILKPEARTLRIEVRPGGRPPGDRSVYLKDDGQVAVF